MNVGKSKVLRCTRNEDGARLNVMLNGEALEEVDQFTYLGSVIAANSGVEADVHHRVNEGCKVLGALKGVMKNRRLGMNVKKVLYEKVVVPTVMYGSESWGMKVTERQKLNVFEMKCLRSMTGVSQLDRVRNEVVRARTGVRRELAARVDMNVSRWFGHVERMDNERLLKKVMNAKADGRSARGRPRFGWMDGVKRALNDRRMDIREASEIPPLNSINILGLQISSSLSWRDHIVQIAKSASKKLGVLFRCKQYFNAAQLFILYTGFIRPCLEYCSHIWGSSPYTSLLDRIESKAIRLIGDPSLTSTLDPLSLRRKVASLSLFYRYYFGHCSDELAACIPPPMAWPRSTRQATFAHSYCVELSNARINQFSDGFFPSTSHLWNSLPSSVFPASFNLPPFKMQVYHHLRDQMA